MITEMTINGESIEKYNARLLDYSVGGTSLSHSTAEAGHILKLPQIYSSILSPRQISITLTFFPVATGSNSRKTTVIERLKRSTENIVRFESDIIGKVVEIGLPDGYYYTAYITNIQSPSLDANGEQDIVYTFSAIRHKAPVAKEVAAGGKVFCESNTKTPCRIVVSVPAARASLTICGIIINTVAANTDIVIDSEKGLITAGGVNKFGDTEFVDFPYLLPGENTISCDASNADITIVYTPIYA